MNDPSEAKASLNEMLTSKKVNEAFDVIANQLYYALEPLTDKAGADITGLAEEAFEANQTSIVAALIKLEQTYDKEDIKFCLQHMAEQMSCMGMLFAKASFIDY